MNNKDLVISTELKNQIEAFGTTPEKVKGDFLRAIARNSELVKADKTSLILGVAQVQEMGLSLDNLDGEASLIPYKDKKTGLTYAQLQVQWKGIRTAFIREVEGAKDLMGVAIRKGDVRSWNKITGEMVFTDQFLNTDFDAVLEREKKAIMGYAGIAFVDKELYGQENFATYMSLETLAKHSKKYSNTISVDANGEIVEWYGEKTVAKAVYRKYKNKYKFKNDKTAKLILTTDQAVIKSDKEVEYIDNPENKGKVVVK